MPEAVERIIMQADMTVLTPGPLVTELLRTLENLADLESPGLASVYRISTESLRRGMDSGMTAQEIKDFLHAHALGEVPQAVDFLIDDVARRHGTLRSGTALAYVRCEDEALLAQAVAAVDSLRLLAPTVAISQQRLRLVLEELRSTGFAPAAEDEHGASIAVHPEPALLPAPRAHAPRREEPDVARAVAALRTAEPTTTPEGPDIGLIEAAARGSRLIVVGYADRNGRPREVTVTPLTVAGGQVVLDIGPDSADFVSATPTPGWTMQVWTREESGGAWVRVTFTQGDRSSSVFCSWNGYPPRVDIDER